MLGGPSQRRLRPSFLLSPRSALRQAAATKEARPSRAARLSCRARGPSQAETEANGQHLVARGIRRKKQHCALSAPCLFHLRLYTSLFREPARRCRRRRRRLGGESVELIVARLSPRSAARPSVCEPRRFLRGVYTLSRVAGDARALIA